MVIEDLSNLPKNIERQPVGNGATETPAPAADRLLASFLDILLHFPLLHLFVSIFLHKLKLLKWVTESNTESMYVIFQVVLIIFLAILVFQSIYIKIFQFTPGMYFMKLRVKSFHHAELTWGQVFLRSAVWIFGMTVLGIPFLEMFSHQKRLLLHDRASETEVFSLKKNILDRRPVALEISAVRLFFLTIAVVFLGWLNTFINFSQSEIESGRLAMREFTERGLLCEDVNEVAERSHVDIQTVESRLEFATSLFMLGQLDQSCLGRELDYAYLKDEKAPNRFFSKSISSPPHSEDRKKYLEFACTENKKWCDLGYLFDSEPGKDLFVVLQNIRKNWPSSSWSYKVAALKIFNQLGQGEEALAIISSLQNDGIQATGLIEQQLKALKRLNRDKDAIEVLRAVHSVVISSDFGHLSAVVCNESVDENCGLKNDSCKIFLNIMMKDKSLMSNSGPSRTLFKYLSCEKQIVENMEYWSLIENEDLQELVQLSLYLQQPSLKAEALVKLRNFSQDGAKSRTLRWDALQLLLRNTNYEKDWEVAIAFWKDFSPFDENYYVASRWILNYAKRQKRENQVLALEKVFNLYPALQVEKSVRLPAADTQVTEKK
jgi:uncharacterized RDD family membrane protein YckC